MIRNIKWAVLGLTICVMSVAKSATTDAPPVPAPSDFDPVPISLETAREQLALQGRPKSGIKLNISRGKTPKKIRADASYVGVVQITPLLLAAPVQVTVNPDKPLLIHALPLEMSRLDLHLEGHVYQLAFASEIVEKAKGFRHVTMSVLDNDDSYARFSINSSNGDIYGTLRTPTATYLFEPGENKGEQIIHRSDRDAQSNLLGETALSRDESPLAKRHRQIDLLAAIRPDHAWTSTGTSFLKGGDLGFMQRVSAESFKRAAMRLSALTGFTGDETFVRTALREARDGGKLATFAQTIGGIPVDSVNEVLVDESGKILQLSTNVLPSDLEPVKPLISEHGAISRAHVEWEAKFSKRIAGIDLQSPVRLRYRLATSADALELYYDFFFTVTTEIDQYFARVDATSGRAEIITTSANVDFRSCKDLGLPTSPTLPTPPASSCSSGGILKGYAIPQTAGFCSNPTGATGTCTLPELINTYQVVTDIQNTLPGAIATGPAGVTPACCTEMNGIDVILNSRAPNLDVSLQSGKKIFMPTSESNSAEILAHEIGHLYQQMYNSSSGGELLVDTNVFAGAIREGGADTFSGLIGAISGRTARYGSQWTFGDGQGWPSGSATRSASNPAFQYWQDVTQAAGRHDSAQVISRFFRRLQEVAGISNQRLLGVLLGTLSTIRDEDSPRNGIDSGDFRRAVQRSIKSDEVALKNAVTTVYSELYRADAAGPLGPPLPPGDPGPIGAPPITPLLSGFFASCGTVSGTPVSVYQTSWTATANTSSYLGWVKANAEPAYKFSIQVPSSVTSALLVTNVPGEGRVSSCNSFGCSGLSLSRVVVSHQPQCGGF